MERVALVGALSLSFPCLNNGALLLSPRLLRWGMPNVMISLKRTRSDQEQPCGVCGATFIPLEDSGARVLKVKTIDEDTLSGLLCGGCHSKWSAGTTVTLNTTKE